jgi:hypothetical protein
MFAALVAITLNTSVLAQVSVFDCYGNNEVTQTQIVNESPIIYQNCVEFPSTESFLFNGSSYTEIRATKQIKVEPGFKAGTFTSTGKMKLMIQTPSPFEVVAMNYYDLSEVRKNDKFELGIALPADLQTKVNNFVTNANVIPSLKINPFLEWNIRIVAEFKNESYPTAHLADAFYFRNFVRNETTDYWDDLGTPYPFRIRFSPTHLGNWICVIKVYINNNLTLISPNFNFNVVESIVPGFVAVHPNGKNLAREGSEDVIYPVGTNLPGPAGGESGLVDYDGGPNFVQNYKMHYLKDYLNNVQAYANQGGKYFRYIVTQPNSEIEFEKLGNYYDRLMFATEIDNLLQVAHLEGMLIHFNLMLHSSIMQMADYNHYGWDFGSNHGAYPTSQYCYATSFNTQLPSDMILNTTTLVDGHPAFDYLKQRYRYYISRYGYSTDIELFELLSEPWHMNADIVAGESIEPAADLDDATGDQARNAVNVFHTGLATYIKDHLGHTQHLIAGLGRMPVASTYAVEKIVGGAYSSFSNINLDYWANSNIDVATISNYSPYTTRLVNSKTQLPITHPNHNFDNLSFSAGASDKSLAYSTQKISEAYDIPTMIAETGTGDLTQECNDFKIHPFDVTRLGFCNLAGFYMWAGFTYFDPTSPAPAADCPVDFWPSVVRTQNHLNGVQMRTILGTNWVFGSEVQEYDDMDVVLEHQYYINHDRTKAGGYVANRTYNVVTTMTNPNIGECWLYGDGIESTNPAIYNPADLHADHRTLVDIESCSGINCKELELQGLLPYTSYYAHWYSYDIGNYMFSYCFTTDGVGKHLLDFPVLYVKPSSISPSTPLSPVVWYMVEESNCNQNRSENETRSFRETERSAEAIQNLDQFEIFPNPVTKNLSIRDSRGIDEIMLFDNLGKRVLVQSFNGATFVELNTESLAKGSYYIQINAYNERYLIVKQ